MNELEDLIFKCKRCTKGFAKKHHLINHLEKKKTCLVCNDGEDILCCDLIAQLKKPIIVSDFKCEYCNKCYVDKARLKQHYAYCKVKREQVVQETCSQSEMMEMFKHTLDKITKVVSNIQTKQDATTAECATTPPPEASSSATTPTLVKKKKTIPIALKRVVWDKYVGEEVGKTKCMCCKLTDITQLTFHCGHVKSEYNGGDLSVDNLRPICISCNSSMGTMDMFDFMTGYQLGDAIVKN